MPTRRSLLGALLAILGLPDAARGDQTRGVDVESCWELRETYQRQAGKLLDEIMDLQDALAEVDAALPACPECGATDWMGPRSERVRTGRVRCSNCTFTFDRARVVRWLVSMTREQRRGPEHRD